MNIIINSQQIPRCHETCANLEDILVELANTSLPANHLVGAVRINGKEFSELYPGQAKEISIAKINDLEIITVSPERFASAALKDCMVFMKKIELSVKDAAELFRISDENKANEYYAKVIDSIRALIMFIENAREAVSWDFTSCTYSGKSVQSYWDGFMHVIEEMSTVQEDSDWVMLADLLEYELSPILLAWQEIISDAVEKNTIFHGNN